MSVHADQRAGKTLARNPFVAQILYMGKLHGGGIGTAVQAERKAAVKDMNSHAQPDTGCTRRQFSRRVENRLISDLFQNLKLQASVRHTEHAPLDIGQFIIVADHTGTLPGDKSGDLHHAVSGAVHTCLTAQKDIFGMDGIQVLLASLKSYLTVVNLISIRFRRTGEHPGMEQSLLVKGIRLLRPECFRKVRANLKRGRTLQMIGHRPSVGRPGYGIHRGLTSQDRTDCTVLRQVFAAAQIRHIPGTVRGFDQITVTAALNARFRILLCHDRIKRTGLIGAAQRFAACDGDHMSRPGAAFCQKQIVVSVLFQQMRALRIAFIVSVVEHFRVGDALSRVLIELQYPRAAVQKHVAAAVIVRKETGVNAVLIDDCRLAVGALRLV